MNTHGTIDFVPIMIVTIDGPAGAGKSTVARALASRFGLPYLNSGYIYRAITICVLDRAVDFDDEEAVLDVIGDTELRFQDDPETEDPLLRTRVLANGEDITGRLKMQEVTDQVWRVANNGRFRAALRETQRRCADPDGLVAEGRDMGSVIFPGADAKFFLEASVEERARRQHREAEAAGRGETYEEIFESIRERDARDFGREDAPLVVPENAVVIRTDGVSVDKVIEQLSEEVEKRVSSESSSTGS